MKTYIKIFILLFSSLFLFGCTQSNSFYTSYDRGDCLTNRFDFVDNGLDIDLQWKYETLYLTWDGYTGEEFGGYYITREESDNCPYYFKGDNYLEYISKSSQTYFKDDTIDSDATYYYRVCVLESDKEVVCGGVKKVTIY
jgi:hypothetical protein